MELAWHPLTSARFDADGKKPLVIKANVHRAKVPGGWFVKVKGYEEYSCFFYPDPDHEWDGSSLPE